MSSHFEKNCFRELFFQNNFWEIRSRAFEKKIVFSENSFRNQTIFPFIRKFAKSQIYPKITTDLPRISTKSCLSKAYKTIFPENNFPGIRSGFYSDKKMFENCFFRNNFQGSESWLLKKIVSPFPAFETIFLNQQFFYFSGSGLFEKNKICFPNSLYCRSHSLKRRRAEREAGSAS